MFDADIREAGIAGEGRSLAQAGFMQLEGEGAVGLKGAGAPGQQAAQHIQAIRTAVERERRLEVGHSARKLGQHRRRHVRRIRHHEVEGAHKLGVDTLPQVALNYLYALIQVEGGNVLAGKGDGLRLDVSGNDMHERMLVGDRTGDAARARTEIGPDNSEGMEDAGAS